MLGSTGTSSAEAEVSSLDGSWGTLLSGSPGGILRSVILIPVGLTGLDSDDVATWSGYG